MDNKNSSHPAAISVGRRLKDAREKKSLTIEQVQKQSKIHSSVLKALEEGHASVLLTDTYVRSFLKKYCQLLGLSSSDILKEYFPPRQDSAPSSLPFEENPLPYETKVGPKALYFTGIAVLGIAAVLVAALVIGKIVSSIGKAKPAQADKRVTAAVSKKKQAKTAKSPQTKKQAAKKPAEAQYVVPKAAPLKLSIKVKETILVTLKADGVLMYSVVMKKDMIDNITAKEVIELNVPRTSALELTLNGRALSLPSNGNMRDLVITRKGVELK